MKKIKHILRVSFKRKDMSILYDGCSFVSKILSDDILIKRNKIEIVFYRSKKMKKSEVLDSPNSYIRIHLQKCLCFYLAVTGEIPVVKSVTFVCGKESVEIEHEGFTQTWKNCFAEINIPAENAKCIFEGGREYIFYVMLTYFIKAQLDNFSHDRFRAAWSALNAIYSFIAEHNIKLQESLKKKKSSIPQERDKLCVLKRVIESKRMENALAKIKELDDEFWKNISWYSLLAQKDRGKTKEYYCNCYDDRYLLELIKKNALGISQKDKKNQENQIEIIDDQLLDELDSKIKMNVEKPEDRLKFIIRKECYSRRNDSFHANKPYPIFVISNNVETDFENTLTEIVLLLFKDLFIMLSKNQNEMDSV